MPNYLGMMVWLIDGMPMSNVDWTSGIMKNMV